MRHKDRLSRYNTEKQSPIVKDFVIRTEMKTFDKNNKYLQKVSE